MNSIFRIGSLVAALLLAVAVLPISTVEAQEEAPADETGSRIGNFYIDVGTWVAQPAGVDFVPASELEVLADDNGFLTTTSRPFEHDHGTEDKAFYRLEYRLPSEMGSFRIGLYKHEQDTFLNRSAPAQFIYAESLAHDIFTGYKNDGRADGFASAASTDLRDLRFEFTRKAFRSPKVAADWFVGWRRVEHTQNLAADYFALVPDLPPIVPPACGQSCPDLNPLLDSASLHSDFEGRGVTAGVDLEFPLWKNDLVFEGSVAISILRGDVTARTSSTNSYYILNDPSGDFERILCLTPDQCDADYEIFDDVFVVDNTVIYQADNIAQRKVGVAVDLDGGSQTSTVIEHRLGFRWRTPYKRLEVFGGFRQARYDDVALRLDPSVTIGAPDENGQVAIGITNLSQRSTSVTYEGFFGGVSFRLY